MCFGRRRCVPAGLCCAGVSNVLWEGRPQPHLDSPPPASACLPYLPSRSARRGRSWWGGSWSSTSSRLQRQQHCRWGGMGCLFCCAARGAAAAVWCQPAAIQAPAACLRCRCMHIRSTCWTLPSCEWLGWRPGDQLLHPCDDTACCTVPGPRRWRRRARRWATLSSRPWPTCARSTATARPCCARTTSEQVRSGRAAAWPQRVPLFLLLLLCLCSLGALQCLRAGLELMDTMGSLQEAAYERLCRYRPGLFLSQSIWRCLIWRCWESAGPVQPIVL